MIKKQNNNIDVNLRNDSLPKQVMLSLIKQITKDGMINGTRLPSENKLSIFFGVSRTVVREAISLLQESKIVETKKGSGTFLLDINIAKQKYISLISDDSIQSLLDLLEVRRSIEAGAAEIAALRRTPSQLAEMEYWLKRIDLAVSENKLAYEEDANFHKAMVAATNNQYWIKLMDMLFAPIRSVVRVTRANEKRKDHLQTVRDEHFKIYNAIANCDSKMARATIENHLKNAVIRLQTADLEFWRSEGGDYARMAIKKSADMLMLDEGKKLNNLFF